MKALDIYHELQKDAYDLIFETSEVRNKKNRVWKHYDICDSEPGVGGINISFQDRPETEDQPLTCSFIYQDQKQFDSWTLQTGWGIGSLERHQRRQFLYKAARLMLDRAPKWYFDLDRLPLEMHTLQFANLSQIEAARQFYVNNIHLCPLSQDGDECTTYDLTNGEVSESLTKLAYQQEYYVGKISPWSDKPFAKWKCSTHNLYLVSCCVLPREEDPFGNSKCSYRYATPINSKEISHTTIDQLNREQATYLEYLYKLEGEIPSKESVLGPNQHVSFPLLLEIQKILDLNPGFFNYLNDRPLITQEESPGIFTIQNRESEVASQGFFADSKLYDQMLKKTSLTSDDAENKKMSDEVAKAIESLMGLRKVVEDSAQKMVCRCTSQSIFQNGCQCGSKG